MCFTCLRISVWGNERSDSGLALVVKLSVLGPNAAGYVSSARPR
jgi:hypothetical protein